MTSRERPVAVVTGAGRGLGRGISLALAEHHDLVLGWHRDRAAVEQTASQASALGATVTLVGGDVVDPEVSTTLVTEACSRFGRLDVWVANAGVSVLAPLVDTAPEDARRMLDVNVLGVFHGLRAAASAMLTAGRGGRIVAIASDLGVQAAPLLAVYSASKFAVVGLVQAAAVELAPAGITINAVCPGTVETDMVLAEAAAAAALRGTSTATVRAELVDAVPAGRLCTPADVGGLVAWLVGPAAGYVTGQALCVNGGSIRH